MLFECMMRSRIPILCMFGVLRGEMMNHRGCCMFTALANRLERANVVDTHDIFLIYVLHARYRKKGNL